MTPIALVALLAGLGLGLLLGFAFGVAYPPCCPGDQRGCNVSSGALGVECCTRSGFGWEPCQSLSGDTYPQALWRR